MFKTLFKKQFMEIMNLNKNNTKKTKASSTRTTIIIWAVALLIVAVALGFLGSLMASSLVPSGLSWLYFSIMGILSIFFGTLGSVFNTYTALYLSKDNDMLLAMPIKPSYILMSRIANVFLLAFIYTASVWIPSCVAYYFFAKATVFSVIYQILLTLDLTLIVTVLTCAIGWVVAYFSTKLKSNKIVTIILSLILIFGLYYVQFNMTNIINSLVTNAEAVSQVMKSWMAPLYYLGVAAIGGHVSMIILIIVAVVLFILTYYLLNITFIKIATTKVAEKKNKYKTETAKKNSLIVALLKKELKKFYSSTAYFLNAGLGLFILLIMVVAAFIKMGDLRMLVEMLVAENGAMKEFVAVAVCLVLSMILGMNCITAPSISLEAKNLWLLKSLPINSKVVIKAKILLAVLYNTIGVIIGGVSLSIVMKLDILSAVLCMIVPLSFVTIMAYLGILLNLKMPNLDWTNEIVPIKQSAPVVICVFGSMILSVVIFVPFVFMYKFLDCRIYLLIVSIINSGLIVLLNYLADTKGVEKFEEL